MFLSYTSLDLEHWSVAYAHMKSETVISQYMLVRDTNSDKGKQHEERSPGGDGKTRLRREKGRKYAGE